MKAGAPPFPARCTCTDDTLNFKKKQEQDAGCLDACPSQAIYRVFKKGEKLLRTLLPSRRQRYRGTSGFVLVRK